MSLVKESFEAAECADCESPVARHSSSATSGLSSVACFSESSVATQLSTRSRSSLNSLASVWHSKPGRASSGPRQSRRASRRNASATCTNNIYIQYEYVLHRHSYYSKFKYTAVLTSRQIRISEERKVANA